MGACPAALNVARRVHRCRALQDKFVAIVACSFGLPEFIRFSVRVFLKVGASVRVGACGWTAQMRCGLRAKRRQRSHSWILGMAGLWGFGLGLVSQKLGCWWREQMALCSERGRNLLLKVPD